MRALALLVLVVPAGARAEINPWSVEIGYRTGGSVATRDADFASSYLHSAVGRVEYSYGRAFVGALFAIPLPGAVGESECSISGGFHHVIREGMCARGDGTALFCGNSIVLDYALDGGVASQVSFSKKDFMYYGPVVRPRISAHVTWPTSSGHQVGLMGTLGVATTFTTTMSMMSTAAQHTNIRVEPTFELSGVIRF